MAVDPQVLGQDGTWRGFGTTGIIPPEYLERGMDNLAQMAFITKGTTRFLHMLHMRFPKSKIVDTREHRIQSISEMDRVLNVTTASTSADNHTTIGIPNSQAAQIQENDILFVKQLFIYVTKTNLVGGQVLENNTFPTPKYPTTLEKLGGHVTAIEYSQTWGPNTLPNPTKWFNYHEQVLVIGVGDPDSAGTGETKITLRRAFMGPGGRYEAGGALIDQGIVNTAVNDTNKGALTTSMELLRGLPAWPEGSGPASGYHKNPHLDYNFTQEFKYAVEITKESKIEKHNMGKSHMDINRMLMSQQASLDVERQFLLGTKSKSMDRYGRVVYTMDGLASLIPHDEQHFHQHPASAIDYKTILDLFEPVFVEGGSMERDYYCGITVYNQIKKSFYNTNYLRYNEEASRNFEIEVEALHVSGGQINLIPLYTLEEAGWGQRGLCLDPSVPYAVPVTHTGWDMRVEEIGWKGQQIEKEEWIGIKGLELAYPEYQHFVDFSQAT